MFVLVFATQTFHTCNWVALLLILAFVILKCATLTSSQRNAAAGVCGTGGLLSYATVGFSYLLHTLENSIQERRLSHTNISKHHVGFQLLLIAHPTR